MTKRQARVAAASQSSRWKTAAALASAAIIRPFQSASTLSSQPGPDALVARGLEHGAAARRAAAPPHRSAAPGRRLRLRMLWPSQLPSGVTS